MERRHSEKIKIRLQEPLGPATGVKKWKGG